MQFVFPVAGKAGVDANPGLADLRLPSFPAAGAGLYVTLQPAVQACHMCKVLLAVLFDGKPQP
jgi:hypothetical protein